MLGVTWRQRAMSVSAAVLALVASIAAVFGVWRVAIAAAGLLLGGSAIVVLDLRRRSGDITRRLKAADDRSATMVESFHATRSALAESVQRLRRIGRRIKAVETAVSECSLDEHVVSLVKAQTEKLLKNETREIEALLQLFNRVAPQEPMPPSGDWALDPQGLLTLYALIQQHRPRLVVELGSGTSTVWVGYALATANAVGVNGRSAAPRLISLDHDPYYADQSKAAIRVHEDRIAHTEVRCAPLTRIQLGGEEFQWYEPSCLADVQRIDLLIVDGPPGNICPQARYPAVPVLREKLSHGALVVLDDADRPEERTIVDRWLEEVHGLVREWARTDRQAVLRYP